MLVWHTIYFIACYFPFTCLSSVVFSIKFDSVCLSFTADLRRRIFHSIPLAMILIMVFVNLSLNTKHRVGPFNANFCCCCFLYGLLLIFCFYFVGRPMIECSECLTWIHLSCAKIRKSNVPDVFICQKCRDAKHTMRRSNRVRTQPKTKAINLKP